MARIWLFILLNLVILGPAAHGAPRFSLVKGVLDLSAWNPEELSTLEISGQAEFVWGRFMLQESWPEPPALIPYPGAWNVLSSHPVKGFASYRLRVKLPQAMKLSLSFPAAWSASAIFINGQLVHQEGRPGPRASSHESSIREPFLWTADTASEALEIVLHVANYEFPLGGPLQSLRLGTPQAVQKAKDRDLAICLFLVGSLMVMAVYHVSLYLMRRKDYAAIWYGFFCLSLSVFLLLGQGLSVTTFFLPDDFRLRIQIFSLAWIASAASFMGYCAALFPLRLSRIYTFFMLAAASVTAGLSLGTELEIMALTLLYFQGVLALGMLIIGHAVYSAWRQQQEGASSFILFSLLLFAGCLNDIALMRGLIQSIPLVPVAAFLFIFGQAFILALRHSLAFKRAAESGQELRQRNETLEAMVSEKTDHTQRMMDEVQGQRDKLQEVNTYISQHILQRFLPPDLVADLVAGKQTFNDQPSMRDVTIFFADLCSFTAATEWIGPQRVARTLNEFLALMTQIIFEEGGTIDKFIGDGIMVIFGAPRELAPVEQAERSCRCALRMQEGLAELNRKWKKEFNHEFQMRVGIHRGPALVGSFGSQLRSDFTAIGNTVNIASRVETQAKAGEILVTSMVRDYLGSIAWEAAGSYKLKGLAGEMVLFRLLKEDKQRAA